MRFRHLILTVAVFCYAAGARGSECSLPPEPYGHPLISGLAETEQIPLGGNMRLIQGRKGKLRELFVFRTDAEGTARLLLAHARPAGFDGVCRYELRGDCLCCRNAQGLLLAELMLCDSPRLRFGTEPTHARIQVCAQGDNAVQVSIRNLSRQPVRLVRGSIHPIRRTPDGRILSSSVGIPLPTELCLEAGAECNMILPCAPELLPSGVTEAWYGAEEAPQRAAEGELLLPFIGHAELPCLGADTRTMELILLKPGLAMQVRSGIGGSATYEFDFFRQRGKEWQHAGCFRHTYRQHSAYRHGSCSLCGNTVQLRNQSGEMIRSFTLSEP